jgi:PAS domain S-box-containing protein
METRTLQRRWERERAARKRAEALLESKAAELYRLNQTLAEELSERSRRLYFTRLAMDLAPDGFCVVSADGEYIYVNNVAASWLGYSLDELSRVRVMDVYARVTEEGWQSFWRDLRASGKVVVEQDVGELTGEERPIEATLSLLEFEGDEYCVVVARDVSERRRLEAERLRRERENERLSLIASRTSNAVVLTDREGRIEWVNEGFTRMTGFSFAESLGGTPGSLLQGPDSDPEIISHMRECVEAGVGFQVEILNYRKDGTPYWVAIEAQPLENDGDITQFMAIESDITQRKQQTEREGRLARLRTITSEALRSMLEDAALGTSVKRLVCELAEFLEVSRARVVVVSRDSPLFDFEWRHAAIEPLGPALNLLSFAEEAGIGAASHQLVISEAGAWQGNATARSMLEEAGVVAMLLMPVVVADRLEATVAFEHLDQPRHWDEEEIAQVQSTVQALWLVLERQARRRLLEQRASDLAREAELAEQASREKTSFLANMSHEIRTPMTAILGYANLLTRNPESAELRDEWAHALESNAAHLLSLVTDVLDFSKIEAGELAIRKQRSSLESILRNALSIVRPAAREKMLELRVHASSRLPTEIQTDPTRLMQILLNLLSNAVKFTDEGSIDVRVGSHVMLERVILDIEVEDTGRGIQRDKLDEIFEKFAQEEPSGPLAGTGLGLSISRSLAQLLGGNLEADSQLGAGSTFTLHIDAGHERDLEWISKEEFDPWWTVSQLDDRPSLPELNGLRVLVVDDSPENIRILRFLLLDAGAEIEEATNGREGVDSVIRASDAGRPFDAVLMDMSMPVLDGYAATQELRNRGFDTYVVALTAYATADDSTRCLEAGCDHYMSKPIETDKLIRLLANRSSRSQSSPRATGIGASGLTSNPALAKLVDEYLAHLGETACELRQACEECDAERIARIAHRLRGTAVSYGFPAIGEAAACCEDVIRGERPWAEVEARSAVLIGELKRAGGPEAGLASAAP